MSLDDWKAFPIPNPRLAQFPGTPIRISYSSDDPETQHTANRIKFVATQAGWSVTTAMDDTRHLQRTGIFVNATGADTALAARQLENLLLANSIDVYEWILPPEGTQSDWYPPTGVVPGAPLVWVIVGRKPNPYFDKREFADKAEPVDDRHKANREERRRLLERLEAEKQEEMRRLREEWFPPGTNKVIL